MQELLRIKNVLATTGLSRSGLYEKISGGNFPKPIKLGPRAVAWIAVEVSDWINDQIEQSRTFSKERSAR